MAANRRVFIAGGTGYLGSHLVGPLLDRGHCVRVLVRNGSQKRLPEACEKVVGDALDPATFLQYVTPADTFVHLVGTSHPAPWKSEQFRAVDLTSVRASADAAEAAGVGHFVYVSVAQPAPVMKTYVEVRRECETRIRATGIPATFLRPWYVLGPGHRWPLVLVPLYRILEGLPATRDAAQRLGLVRLDQMVAALVWAVEHPAEETRILDVPWIRRF